MVTKRKPRKQNSEQGAPAKPARPSVKGKTVARPEARPDSSAQGAKAAGATPGASWPAGAASAQKPAEQHKPKRRIAMPQSSSRLKQNKAARGEESKAAAGAAASMAASAGAEVRSDASGKPTPRRRVKSFPVAKAEKTAGKEAEKLAGGVSRADVAAAEDSARASLAADAAKRRLERRQRKLQHQAEANGSADGAATAGERGASGKKGFSLPHVGKSAAVSAGQTANATEAADAEQDTPRARKKHAFHISWPVGVALAVLAIVVTVVAVFSWGRWARYDDVADFQGMWYANGTTSIVTVDGEKIHLTDDVAYNYMLDTGAKTITFTFGQMEGHGRYRFSVDRSELVITDGNDFTFWGNLFDDIGWQLGQAISSMQGNEIQREAVVDGVTVLDRTQTQGASGGIAQQSAASSSAADADGGEQAASSASADGEGGDDGTDVSAGESSDSAEGTTDSTFEGAVAEGGIDSAGSNAVTLEQLKSGSL